MPSTVSMDDVRLVVAVARTGSIGAAARSLAVSQPSASSRLARIERRCGLELLERSSTGSRPTAAGQEFVRRGEQILHSLDGLLDASRAAAWSTVLRVGTFPTMAPALFPILAAALRDTVVDQWVDESQRLVNAVTEGTLDACLIGFADQLSLSRGVTAHPVGQDLLVVLVPAGATSPTTRRRQPLRGLAVTYATYDYAGERLGERLAALGATPSRAGTVATAIAMARRNQHLAVVPRSAVASDLREGERLGDLPFTVRIRLSLVAGPEIHPSLRAGVPAIRDGLGLT